MQLTFSEFCIALARAWWAVLAILVVAVGAAIAVLGEQVRVYQSTATVQLTSSSSDLSVLSHVDAITPVYAEAIQSERVATAAQQQVPGKLADISARTFTGSPVIKIDAQSTSPQLAQASAQAIVDVVNLQSSGGDYGYANISLLELQPPVVPTEPVSPRPVLTIAVAAVVGLGFGTAAALLLEAGRRRKVGRRHPAPAPAPAPAADARLDDAWRVTPLVAWQGDERRRLEEELDAALAPLNHALQRVRTRTTPRGAPHPPHPPEARSGEPRER